MAAMMSLGIGLVTGGVIVAAIVGRLPTVTIACMALGAVLAICGAVIRR